MNQDSNLINSLQAMLQKGASTEAAPNAARKPDLALSTEQNNLGKDQSALAAVAGSTISGEGSDNQPVDDNALRLMADDKATAGNGPTPTLEVNEPATLAKTAHTVGEVTRLARGLRGAIQKQAATVEAPLQKTAAEEKAEDFAAAVYTAYLSGMQKRAMDEAAIAEDPELAADIDAAGGTDVVLDNLAMEGGGEAVLPDELAGELPVEEAPMGGADLDALEAELTAAGVTPEQVEQADSVLQALLEEGVTEEEVIRAVEEMAAEDAGEEIPADFGGETLEEGQKIASIRHTVNFAKQVLRELGQ